MQEVRDSLYQEISVPQIGKEEGHFTFSADGQRAGQDTGTIGLLNYCHLEDKDKGRRHLDLADSPLSAKHDTKARSRQRDKKRL